MDQQNDHHDSIKKFNIKLKTKPKDGVILQLHHTVKSSKGDTRRIRFTTGTFDDINGKVACSDNNGNLFILDLCDENFWKVSHSSPSTALLFIPDKVDTILVALRETNNISFMDIESGSTSISLTGHTAPVKNMSLSSSKINRLLTSSAIEAILWEMKNYTKYFILNINQEDQIQQIVFTPASDYLVACFQNDTIQAWKTQNMKSMKQIVPNELKNIKYITFTRNSRAMVIAGLSSSLILFSMDTWSPIKTINLNKYNISGVQYISFIPEVFDGGANKILAILSSDCVLNIYDIEHSNIIYKICPDSSRIRNVVISPSGKYFLCILQLGEVNIYSSSYVLSSEEKGDQSRPETPSCSNRTSSRNRPETKKNMEQNFNTYMDSARLRRIIMQYGEYPEKFRTVIWQSLLNTPNNKSAYSALIDKGIHSTYKDLEKRITIQNTIVLKHLKILLSCLSHWCPLFAVMKFLPGFVFPFVKILQKDPLFLFEAVSTILVNYCQLWFEYAPFPPISVLSMIENILAQHDIKLLDSFCKIGVTSQVYALKLLETAFSEVLTCSEWLILWDHVLSNEPSFILMAVASYSIVQRTALKKLNNVEEFKNYYQMQNPINMKYFLKKAYTLLNETPADVHPRQFLNIFSPLEKGSCYQTFSGYPKATVCMKLAKKERKKLTCNDKNLTLRELTKISQQQQIREREISNNVKKVEDPSDTVNKSGHLEKEMESFIKTFSNHSIPDVGK